MKFEAASSVIQSPAAAAAARTSAPMPILRSTTGIQTRPPSPKKQGKQISMASPASHMKATITGKSPTSSTAVSQPAEAAITPEVSAPAQPSASPEISLAVDPASSPEEDSTAYKYGDIKNRKDQCIVQFQFLADMSKSLWDFTCTIRFPISPSTWNMKYTPMRPFFDEMSILWKEISASDDSLSIPNLLQHSISWFSADDDLSRGLMFSYIDGAHSNALLYSPLCKDQPDQQQPTEADRGEIFNHLAPHIFQHHGFHHHRTQTALSPDYEHFHDTYPRFRKLFLSKTGGDFKLSQYELSLGEDMRRALQICTANLDMPQPQFQPQLQQQLQPQQPQPQP